MEPQTFQPSMAEQLAARVLSRKWPEPPRRLEMPPEDDPETLDVATMDNADGQSFVIEYVDARGRVSIRRITVRGTMSVEGAGGIVAFCHGRRAVRLFRTDRIRCCIDDNGEVFTDVYRFLAGALGQEFALFSASPQDGAVRWRDISALIRNEAIILAAVSLSDGDMAFIENEVATSFLARYAESGGLMLTEAEIVAIGQYCTRLRPTEAAINRAVEYLSQCDHRHIQKVLLAAVAVLEADGRRHPAEIAIINALSLDLIGAPIVS